MDADVHVEGIDITLLHFYADELIDYVYMTEAGTRRKNFPKGRTVYKNYVQLDEIIQTEITIDLI